MAKPGRSSLYVWFLYVSSVGYLLCLHYISKVYSYVV